VLLTKSVGKDNQAEAVRVFTRGCELYESWACANLGYMYAEAMGVTKDLDAARRFLTVGCEDALEFACTELGKLPKPAP
jgi:TPR repeat protein